MTRGISSMNLQIALAAREHGKILFLEEAMSADIGVVCTLGAPAIDTYEQDKLLKYHLCEKSQPEYGWYRKFEKKRF